MGVATSDWRRFQNDANLKFLFFVFNFQNAGHELKDSALAFNGAAAAAAAAAGWPYPSMYYPYDPAMAAYPFGG